MFGWQHEDELRVHQRIAYALLIQTLFIFPLLYFVVPAPWGKTISYKFGPLVPARLSWFVFESPNLVWSYLCWNEAVAAARRSTENASSSQPILPVANQILLSLFALHYVQRALLYPLFMSPLTTPMPLAVVASAFTFCTFNGYLQAQALCRFVSLPTSEWHYQLQFVMGIVLFLVGAAINIDSDARLRRLRVVAAASAAAKKTSESTTTPLNPDSSKNHRSKYAIPHGAFFEYVSTPHYFGEIVEWTGFCIASNYSLASVAFVVYTAANLIPRGVAHHAWYQATFDNYPSNRKAVIPFLW